MCVLRAFVAGNDPPLALTPHTASADRTVSLLGLISADLWPPFSGKYSIGRLRPHFIDVCKPDFTKINCSNHAYVEDFVCQGDDEHAIKEARYGMEP